MRWTSLFGEFSDTAKCVILRCKATNRSLGAIIKFKQFNLITNGLLQFPQSSRKTISKGINIYRIQRAA